MEKPEYGAMRSVEETHWWYVGLHELLERFASLERARAGRLSILDAGCGTGRLCEMLSRYGEVHGIDASGEALSHCRARGLENLTFGDLATTDLGARRYDLITCIDVLCHRWVPDDVGVLRRFQGALRPGGTLLLQVPALRLLRGPHDTAVMTRERYRKAELGSRLRAAGFEVKRLTYRVALLFPPIALHRMARRLGERFGLAAADHGSDVRPVSPALNSLLLGIVRLENRLLGKVSLPVGSSVFAAAKKPT